jgi:hypothetical protein
MRNPTIIVFVALIIAGIGQLGYGQSLELTYGEDASNNRPLSVNFLPEGSGVVALQFDLQFKMQRIDPNGVQVMRGQSLTAEHGFDFQQIQPGRIRVVVYPPIRPQMPPLAGGQVASIRFPGLEKLVLVSDDLSFIPGSIVLSDSSARTVAVRTVINNLSKGRNRIKE